MLLYTENVPSFFGVDKSQKTNCVSKDFDGSLSDKDLMAVVGVSRNSFYKYKKELIFERAGLDV